MRIDLTLDKGALAYLNELKKKHDELVVPLTGWITYIRDNPNIKPEDIPNHMVTGAYVITEREYFGSVARSINPLFYRPQRLQHEQVTFWYDKLESKKIMPKHDIFDVGYRVPGSFHSKE